MERLFLNRVPGKDALGTRGFTVGSGGNFADVAAAITYLQGLPTTELYETLTVSGALVATAQGLYKITGNGSTNFEDEIRAGDLIENGSDNTSSDPAPIYYEVRWHPESANELYITDTMTANAGTAYTVIRPKKFVFKLLAGDQGIGGTDLEIPNGCDVTFVGDSRGTTALLIDTVEVTTSAIIQPRYGKLTIANMTIGTTLAGQNSFMKVPTLTSTYWNSATPSALQDSTITFNMINITMIGAGTNRVKASQINVFNSTYEGSAGRGWHFICDALDINGFKSFMANGEDIMVTSTGNVRVSRIRDHVIKNCAFTRLNGVAGAAYSALEIFNLSSLAGGFIKHCFMDNITIYDENQGDANDFALELNSDVTNNTLKIVATNIVSDFTGLGGNLKVDVEADVTKSNIITRTGVNLLNQAIIAADAIELDAPYVSLSVAAGTYAVTLAAPTASEAGETKTIEMIDATGTSVTMLLTNVIGGSLGTLATFNAVNDTLTLIAVSNKWVVLDEHGVVLT